MVPEKQQRAQGDQRCSQQCGMGCLGYPAAGWRSLSPFSINYVAVPALFCTRGLFWPTKMVWAAGEHTCSLGLKGTAQRGDSFHCTTTDQAEREGKDSLVGADWAWTAPIGGPVGPLFSLGHRWGTHPIQVLETSV